MKAAKIVAFALAVPLALALAALLVAVGLTAANTDFSNPADLKEFARNKMAKAGIPALSVAYIRGGKISSAWALGTADPERGIPADEETIFQIASVSKTVTATAAMQLAERGLIDLDADIDRYLPFAVDHPAHPDALISARMLLAHRSGIADNWGVYNPLYTIGAGAAILRSAWRSSCAPIWSKAAPATTRGRTSRPEPPARNSPTATSPSA